MASPWPERCRRDHSAGVPSPPYCPTCGEVVLTRAHICEGGVTEPPPYSSDWGRVRVIGEDFIAELQDWVGVNGVIGG